MILIVSLVTIFGFANPSYKLVSPICITLSELVIYASVSTLNMFAVAVAQLELEPPLSQLKSMLFELPVISQVPV